MTRTSLRKAVHLAMNPTVTKSCRSLVRPQAKTPSGILPLSPIDKVPFFRRLVDIVLVFTHGHYPANVIRESLSLTLNHYYPLAGRLCVTDEGDLEVACTGEGAWFIEASADCSLEDVNFLEHPLKISEEEILPYPRPGVDPEDALVMIQVTEFTCGGFAVVCRVNHVVFDGTGHGQFLNAIGEIARKALHPTIPPIWSRGLIPGPPQPPSKHPLFPKVISTSLDYDVIDVSLKRINQLKSKVRAINGPSATTFEILGSLLWQCHIRVAAHDPQLSVQFWFAMNVRRSLQKHLLPEGGGYYGNLFHAGSVKSTSGEITSASISEVIRMIREVKRNVPVEFLKWSKGEVEVDMTSTGDLLVVNDWRRLGHSEVDFGWGVPLRWGPLTLTHSHYIPFCILINPPIPSSGVRLLTKVVTKENWEGFLHETMCNEPRRLITSSL